MRTEKQITGSACEQIAQLHLSEHGLQLIEANVSYHNIGEIDLIMYDAVRERLVFVEVRYRKENPLQSASASVTRTKQRKIIKAAQRYLQQKKIRQACRFDVVAISGELDAPNILWIKNAFYTQ